mmetsp:Transcript_14949/g.18230  ORF Transcript_14949/g.18230 Transcript_14949/m.18230 type:complete len:202 (+) Transcript_14949:1104-1709(+)
MLGLGLLLLLFSIDFTDCVILEGSSIRTFLKILLIAITPASFVKLLISAPTNPGVFFASFLKSKSPLNLIPLVIALRILSLPSSSGTPRNISLSNLPALLNAESIESGLLVAPNTMTGAPERLFSGVKESIHVSNCATILFSIPFDPPDVLPSPPRFGAIASISSINIILGAEELAVWNKSRILLSLSPLIPLTSSGALIL